MPSREMRAGGMEEHQSPVQTPRPWWPAASSARGVQTTSDVSRSYTARRKRHGAAAEMPAVMVTRGPHLSSPCTILWSPGHLVTATILPRLLPAPMMGMRSAAWAGVARGDGAITQQQRVHRSWTHESYLRPELQASTASPRMAPRHPQASSIFWARGVSRKVPAPRISW